MSSQSSRCLIGWFSITIFPNLFFQGLQRQRPFFNIANWTGHRIWKLDVLKQTCCHCTQNIFWIMSGSSTAISGRRKTTKFCGRVPVDSQVFAQRVFVERSSVHMSPLNCNSNGLEKRLPRANAGANRRIRKWGKCTPNKLHSASEPPTGNFHSLHVQKQVAVVGRIGLSPSCKPSATQASHLFLKHGVCSKGAADMHVSYMTCHVISTDTCFTHGILLPS